MSRPLALVFCLFLVWSPVVWGQTNPTPQSLPYSQDFGSLAYPSTTYPTGIQGWLISNSPGPVFNTASPMSDRGLTESATAETTSGGIHNYNGKIGFLNTSIHDAAIVVALDTSSKSNISLSYTIMTIRNPYNGSTNTRINEVTLQYRVGTEGGFTNLTGIEYQNNTTLQDNRTTTAQNSQSRNIDLPSSCSNKPIVQVRLASRQVSGTGRYPSFAIDNISVTGDDTLPVVLSSFTASMNANNHVSLLWVTQSETNALGYYAYRADCDNLENAVLVSELIGATNTSQQQMYCFVDEEALPVGTYWYWLESRDLDGSYNFHGPVSMRVEDIDTGPPQLPSRTFLNNPYPNPFNPATQIRYQLAKDTDVSIRIYNLRGQVVREFPTMARGAGSHSFEWNGKDSTGTDCASGIYRIVMSAGGESYVRKVALVK